MALITASFSLYDRFDNYIDRLHSVTSAYWEEKLDGTDELEITCASEVSKGDKVVWVDDTGGAHEHIVDELERTHDSEGETYTTFKAINSIADTWDDWIDDKRPSGNAAAALTSLLAGTHWSVGTCDQEGTQSATFYHQTLREALNDFFDTWGGELETTITLKADGFGVAKRTLGCRAARGDQESPKRFTWNKDMTEVKRSVANTNPKTRIYCYGKGVETESGGYGRRLTIAEVNDGKEYVEDAEATKVWGHKDANGNVIAASDSFVDEECEDASILKAEGLAYLEEVKEPKVTYTASVLFLKAFGRDWEGFGLGDNVLIVDQGFSSEGVRLRGRISSIKHNLLDGDGEVEFGNLTDSMADMFSSITQTLQKQSDRNATYDNASSATPSWLDHLMNSMNDEFNNTGTYKVETFELGTIYSNVALDSSTGLPLKKTSNMWAMNLNGKGLRLASGLTDAGEWNWRTFGTGTGFTADEINAGTINALFVKIKNLMEVGDESNNLSLSSKGISFYIDGSEAVTFNPITTRRLYGHWHRSSVTTHIRFSYANTKGTGGRIVLNKSCSMPFSSLIDLPPVVKPHIYVEYGKTGTTIIEQICTRDEASGYGLSREKIISGGATVDLPRAGGGDFGGDGECKVSLANNKLTFDISITIDSSISGVAYGIYDIYIFCDVVQFSGEITSPNNGAKFITTNNLNESLLESANNSAEYTPTSKLGCEVRDGYVYVYRAGLYVLRWDFMDNVTIEKAS